MNTDQIFTTIKLLKSEKVDVVYISYTGARIIVWVIFNLICIASLGTTSPSLSQVISQFQDHTSQQPSSSDDQPRERLDSPILSRNVDSVEEQISLNNGEQYSSFSSSAEHSPQALTDEPTQNRIQTDILVAQTHTSS